MSYHKSNGMFSRNRISSIADLFINIFCRVAEMLLYTENITLKSNFQLSTRNTDLIIMNYLRNCHLEDIIGFEDGVANVKPTLCFFVKASNVFPVSKG